MRLCMCIDYYVVLSTPGLRLLDLYARGITGQLCRSSNQRSSPLSVRYGMHRGVDVWTTHQRYLVLSP